MSGTDLGLLKNGSSGNKDLEEVTYTLMANGKTISPCNSTGVLLIPGTDKYNVNTAGSIMYFGSSTGLTFIAANAEITIAVNMLMV